MYRSGRSNPPDSVRVTLAYDTVNVTDLDQSFATAYWGRASTRFTSGPTWKTSDTSIATIRTDGVARARHTGAVTISATVNGVSGSHVLQIMNPLGVAAQLGIRTQPAGATSGRPLTSQPAVEIRDANGSLVTGSTLAVTAAIASGNGTLSGTTTVSAVGGVATFTNLVVSGSGPVALTFSASGMAAIASNSFNVASAAATQLAITTQPSSTAMTGAAFAQQPAVQLRDAANNAVAQSGVVIAAAIASGSGGTLGGTASATTNASGVATFTNLNISGNGAYTLTFSATGLTAATSNAITISVPAPVATQLAMITQPSATVVSGVALAMQPAVQLRDASNNAIAQSGVVVTASIATGSAGTLNGTTTATTNTSGVASFTNLAITGSGAYTLRFAAANLSAATSSAISVSAAVTPPPPPPVGATEPVYSSGQVMILSDDFDSYNSLADAVAGGWRTANGATTQDATTNSSGANQLVSPGYDGTGHAIRLVYNGVANCATQECHAWDRPNMNGDNVVGMAGKTFYMSFYTRIIPGAGYKLDQDAQHIVKVKWLELWNTSDRAQFNTSYSQCDNDVPYVGASGSGTMWQFYGQAAAVTKCNAGQAHGPFAYQGASQWHRVTYKYVSQSAAGARDGIAQMWYDGTLVVSVAQGYCGIRVPGTLSTVVQNWCETTDQDAMFVNTAITHLTLGSVMTASLWPFAIDYDHMRIWRDP